jgi:hypothetical protein
MHISREDLVDQQPIIALPNPRREWILHCYDAAGELGVCAITVERGGIAIYGPAGSNQFDLDPTGIAEFREAFTAAVDTAEADLREKATLNS